MTPNPEMLPGVVYVENRAVKVLEETLGIKFHTRPLRIEMRFNNRLAMIGSALRHPNYAPTLLDIALPSLTRRKAFYIERFHTVVLKDNNLTSDLHEHMHGLIREINPGFYIHKERQENPEMDWIYYCVDEGLSDWGALTAGSRWGNTDSIAQAKHIEEVSLLRYPKYVEDLEQLLEDSKQFHRRLTGGLVRQLKMRLFLSAARMPYVVGYKFVRDTISELTESGLPEAESLVLLIENPPTKLEQLRNPVDYAQALLAA